MTTSSTGSGAWALVTVAAGSTVHIGGAGYGGGHAGGNGFSGNVNIWTPPVTSPPFVDTTSLVESARRVSQLPDHPWAGGDRLFSGYCQDCPNGSIYMSDPAAHPYFIELP